MSQITDIAAGFHGSFDRQLWIRGSLYGGGLLLVLTSFTYLMQILLALLGDELGSEVAQISAITTGLGFFACHLMLVTLLALASLEGNMENVSSSRGRPSS